MVSHAISQVVPNLFVGNLYAAQDATTLEKRGIQHVLVVLDDDYGFLPVRGVKYRRFRANADSDFLKVCQTVYLYLERNMLRSSPHPILVSCAEGCNRSVCALAYFLCRYELVDGVDEALRCIAEKRKPIIIKPNAALVEQIKDALED